MEIPLTKACIYKDGRCHGVFTDGSAIVLHKGGQYMTYFSPTGEITRQVTLCTVGGMKSKVLKLINLCNSSLPHPISIFSEEIYKVTCLESKVLSCTLQNPGTIKVICGQSEISSISLNESNDRILLINQDEKGNLKMKSVEKALTASLNPTKTLLRLTYPFLLPHRKPSWSESSTNRVRLSYEYVTLTQIFHVSNLPEPWQPVLHLLLSCSGESYPLPDRDEFSVMFPTSACGEIWSADTVSPAINVFSYLTENVAWYWQPEATFYVPQAQLVAVLIHEDQSLLEGSGEFYTHIREGNVIKFTAETVPVNVRGGSYKLHGFVKDCQELQRLPVVQKVKNVQDEEIEYLDGVKFENEVEGVGSFIAYNDRSIRVLFEDRTLIRVYSDFTVSAISRSGESAKFSLENPYGFESYVPVCVEFYNWAFLSQTEQARRQNEAAEREAVVHAELSRVERLSMKPQVEQSAVPENVSESLLAAQRQLQETRDLLSKLNKL